MAWIESHQSLRDHPKVFDLMRLMGWDLDSTLGKLHRFWWWCVDYAEDGDLRKHNDARIGAAAGLSGEASKKFVQAMVEARWLDRKPYFRVHEWWSYIGRFLQVKYKRKAKKWKRVRDLYEGGSRNRSKNGSGNRKPYQPNQPDQPNHSHQTLPTFEAAVADAEFKEQLKKAYPAVHVEQEIEKMRAWIKANPQKAKKQWRRFVQGWISRYAKEQESMRGKPKPVPEDPRTDRAAKLDAITEQVEMP